MNAKHADWLSLAAADLVSHEAMLSAAHDMYAALKAMRDVDTLNAKHTRAQAIALADAALAKAEGGAR